jgi:uncharacterized protein with NAD-binding domain and iron-sulfur cluster
MARIAILGGGMAALSAAYQLTRPELNGANQVTVYTLGWRLGGKAASGMDGWGRNLEHGLHVWFGCYENTFQMIQEVYAARAAPPPGQQWAFQTWQNAVEPQLYTPIGTQAADGSWSYFKFSWPPNTGTPGDGDLFPTAAEMFEEVLGWLIEWIGHGELADEAGFRRVAGPMPGPEGAPARPSEALRHARPHLRAALLDPTNKPAMALGINLIAWARDALAGAVGGIPSDVVDIFLAVTTGLWVDIIEPDKPLLSIDHIEFRDWLLSHGANPGVVANSSIVRVVYDTLFQYQGGDATQPNLAAGTGVGVVLRLVGTYKGSMMWEVQAGMGEVMVGPLYQQLLAQGVNFEFFSKVIGINPGTANGKPIVQSVIIQPQAAVSSGSYNPITVSGGLVHWPAQPDWGQLVNGPAMQTFGTNFESHWCAYPPGVTPPSKKPLVYGQDFDDVILAIALGAFKPLNQEDVSLAQSLIDADPDFASWVNNVDIVPSLGVQLWCNETTAQLGWTDPKPACVSGPEYIDIWADMSQVIAFEPWTGTKPASLHYLTGTWATTLYTQPASATGTPAQAYDAIRTLTINWLNQYSALNWPLARAGAEFDWTVLVSPNNYTGENRIDDQWLRPNVDPSECCTLSGANTTQYRPHATSNYFTNLYFAGEGTTMGFTTSFEGSVMSGAAASQAICQSPAQIIGYNFLDVPPSQWETKPPQQKQGKPA